MKKHSIFLLLTIAANYISAGYSIPQKMVDIDELNMVGPHPERITLPLKLLKNHSNMRINSMLVFGPSGTGRSKYAEEIARVADCNFIEVSGHEFASGNEPIQRLKNVFIQAKQGGSLVPNFDPSKPTVISIKDADAISNQYDEATANTAIALWASLDRIDNTNIFVFLSTQHPNRFHHQLLRRMGLKVETKLPDEATRQKLFKFYLADFPELEEHFEKFVKASNKASHKDIARACSNAIQTMHYQETILTPELVLIELAKEINTQSTWAYISELAKNNPILTVALTTGAVAAVVASAYGCTRR